MNVKKRIPFPMAADLVVGEHKQRPSQTVSVNNSVSPPNSHIQRIRMVLK